MEKIIIQSPDEITLERLNTLLKTDFDFITVAPDELLEAMLIHKGLVSGVILFELDDKSLKFCELVRNERFGHPFVPVALVGPGVEPQTAPFGAKCFEPTNVEAIAEFVSSKPRPELLLVEDDDGIREVLTLILSKYYSVTAVADGNAGFEEASKGTYDLIVLDIMLPGKSGKEVFEQSMTLFPTIPIVMVTAYDTEQREMEYLYSGAAAYVKKPIESNSAFRTIIMNALADSHKRIGFEGYASRLNAEHDQDANYKDALRKYL